MNDKPEVKQSQFSSTDFDIVKSANYISSPIDGSMVAKVQPSNQNSSTRYLISFYLDQAVPAGSPGRMRYTMERALLATLTLDEEEAIDLRDSLTARIEQKKSE